MYVHYFHIQYFVGIINGADNALVSIKRHTQSNVVNLHLYTVEVSRLIQHWALGHAVFLALHINIYTGLQDILCHHVVHHNPVKLH